MQSVEPMTMGSPASSPSSHNPYLPSYLLGHPTSPVAPSPTNRMWAPAANSPSKPPTGANKSGVWSSSGPSVFSPPNRDLLPPRGKDKSGAPPVQGLLDHITSPTHTSDRKFDLLNQSGRTNQSFQHTVTSPQGAFNNSTFNHLNTSEAQLNNSLFGVAKKTSPSPAQIDPFYTQGENIRPTDELDETWVTIFGFPAAAASFILQQFSQYGYILKHVVSSEGNWLHIHYQSKLQAKKALSKNGKIFGGSIMVGVTRCIDMNVMASTDGECSYLGSPALHNSTLDVSTVGSGTPAKHPPIRPLTAAYRAASSDQEVVMKSNTPQKSGTIITKAMEYMFGW